MPRVSIGLPVYNGEKMIAGAVESLLAQTMTDFELVIVDNASTDGSQEICRALAARAPGVRYHRNDRNIGLAPNWNRAFELASAAPYFKWAAHDDIHAPTFLERCLEVLDRDPPVVLATSKTDYIDADGNKIDRQPEPLPLDASDPLVRLQALLFSHR